MGRNIRTQDTYGDNVIWLHCEICGFEGEVWYSRKPPTYCSDACKQKAYRQRQRKNDHRIPLLVDDARQRGYGFVAGHLRKFGEKHGAEALEDLLPLLDMTARELRRLKFI